MSKNIAEFSIINDYFRPLIKKGATAQNLADDVAKISIKSDEELVISKDMIVEDIHFLRKDGGFKIASKLLRTNLSDIAASGAKPLYYMLGFAKDKKMDRKFLAQFSSGLKSVQDEFGLSLIGGDTVATSEKLFFSLTIFGVIKKNKSLLRQNAKDGDIVFVSGNIGDAALGLKISQGAKINFSAMQKKYFLERYFFPTPRINLGQKLVEKNLSCCAIDVSDGLLSDLRHICKASKLSAFIYQDKIPLNDELRNNLKEQKSLLKNISLLDLISAGDDYELIFTAKKSVEKKILQLAKALKIKITAIGVLKKTAATPDVAILDNNNQIINFSRYGYQH